MSVHLLSMYCFSKSVVLTSLDEAFNMGQNESFGKGQTLPIVPMTCWVKLQCLSPCLNSIVLWGSFQCFQISELALLKSTLYESSFKSITPSFLTTLHWFRTVTKECLHITFALLNRKTSFKLSKYLVALCRVVKRVKWNTLWNVTQSPNWMNN